MNRGNERHGSDLGGLLAGGALCALGELFGQSDQLERIVGTVGDQPCGPARHAGLRNARVPSDVSLSQTVLAGQRLNDVFGSRHASHGNAFMHCMSTHSCIGTCA